MRGKASRHGKGAPETVRLSDIDVNDTLFQLRIHPPTPELLSSLEREGQREPVELLGITAPFRIVDGFRRIAAARNLGWHSVKALIHRKLGDREGMKIAFTKRIAVNNLSIPEKTHAMGLARRLGLSNIEIAELFDLSEREVRMHLEQLGISEP